MQSGNILFKSLKKSFVLIWKNKPRILLLFALQLVFFLALFYLSYTHLSKIMESAKSMSDYMSGQKFDDVTLTNNILQQKDILGDNPGMLEQNFNSIILTFRIFLFYFFAVLLVFLSLVWALTARMLEKHGSGFKKILLRNFIVLSFCLGIIFVFFYLILNISFSEAALEVQKVLAKYIPFSLFSLIILYFAFISLSLSGKYSLNEIMAKSLKIGIKKIHYMLFVYFVIFILIILSLYIGFYFIEINFFVSTIALVLFIFSFVFGRILLFNLVNELDKNM